MRVLVTNKFWYRRGGLERVMFDEIEWLEGAGHEVAHFSANHPRNISSPWSSYFAPYLELGSDGGLSAWEKSQAATRMFSNRVAADRFTLIVEDFRPDVIHIHGIHRQLSPSILRVARRAGIPVVQTLHDYHHLCPADVLLRGGTDVCDPRACAKYWYGPAVIGRCVHGSAVASTLSALETCYQRIARSYERGVSRFITPSTFMANRMKAGGWDAPPCDVIPNAVPVDCGGGLSQGFLFVGRLAPEKGVSVFLEAARSAGVRAMVAGDGPLAEELRCAFPEAEFLGWLRPHEMTERTRNAMAVVVPSVWYENAPMSILEAMAMAVPVIASRIGGIPEQVRDGRDGVLCEPGDVDALAAAILAVSGDSDLRDRLGASAHERVATVFSPEKHLELLLDTYAMAVNPR